MKIVYKKDLCCELFNDLCFSGGDTVDHVSLNDSEFRQLVNGWEALDKELVFGDCFQLNEKNMELTVEDDGVNFTYEIRVKYEH